MPIIVDRIKKREVIIRSAMQVFARDGYHMARMEDVAKEAGIGKGTIYEYFRSKTDLFLALHEYMLSELKSFYLKELSGIREPTLILERFIKIAFQTFLLWEPFFLVFFDFWSQGGRGEHQALFQRRLREAYSLSRDEVAAIIITGIADGSFRAVDPLLTAASILASLDGLVVQWLCDRNAFDLDRMRDELTNGVMRSLRP